MNALDTHMQTTRVQPGLLLRFVAVAAIVAGAWVHFSLWRTYGTIPTVGPMFLADAIFSIFIAAALLVSDDLFVLVVGTGFQIGALGALALSHYGSLFGFHNKVITSDTVVALVTEVVAVLILGGLAIMRIRETRSRSGQKRI
jgi:hypothetical protein